MIFGRIHASDECAPPRLVAFGVLGEACMTESGRPPQVVRTGYRWECGECGRAWFCQAESSPYWRRPLLRGGTVAA
jgi:hypothetical protein